MKRYSTLSRLLKLFLKQKTLIILGIVGMFIQVVLTVYVPVLIGQAVNIVIGPYQVDFLLLIQILGQLSLVIGLNTIVQWSNPFISNRLVYHVVSDLRDSVIVKIHRVPLNYIDTQSTGALVSKITTDSDQLTEGLLMVFNQFFIGFLTILATLGAMLKLDRKMMIVVFVLTPLSMLVAQFIARRSYDLFTKQTSTRSKHAQIIEESVSLSEVSRLFNYQEERQKQFNIINEKYANYSLWAIFYSSCINPTTRFINALIFAIITFLGVMRIMSGTFTVGELTIFLNYANQYMKPFNDISNVLAEIQSAIASAERLFEIIDQPDELETGKNRINAEVISGEISFVDVDFSYYKEKPLLNDVSFIVHPGQTVAIVGPTGAGKSTLINLLMRFYDVDDGKICIDGIDMNKYLRSSIRSQFGMVLQETWIKEGTIYENIAYGHLNVTEEEVIRAAKAAHAHRFISMLPDGYNTYLTDNGSTLSTGQQQLIAIARIFIDLPPMLILDEATSSIDTRTEILIQEAFDTLMEGRTTFIIAHRLSTIQNADQILVLDQGQIIEHGDHNSLMKKQGFYYELQMAGKEE